MKHSMSKKPLLHRPQTHFVLFIGAALLLVLTSPAISQEVLYPSKDFAKLDTFEAVAVEDADKLFIAKDYPGAYAAYKAYSIEFAQGEALPYVLLRMGRCLHLAGKRNAAIKAYQDVVDYFPNDVAYAAAALYHIGQCQQQNGSDQQALATWAKLVKDDQYVGEPNSGSALIALSKAMQDRGNFDEAAKYQWRTAVAFRKSNPKASEQARKTVVFHYTVRKPNHDKLLAFCNEVGGFGWRQNIDVPEDSPAYWQHVLSTALSAKLEDEKRVEIARYWDAKMGDRFADNDSLRVAWFATRLAHNKDAAEWAKRMDEQFKLQPATVDRVKRWLSYYSSSPKARSAFFARHGKPLLSSLDTAQKMSLINYLHHPHRMDDEASQVLTTVKTDGMHNATLRDYANLVARYQGEDAFLRAVGKIKDATFAAKVRFDYYYSKSHRNGENQQKALAEVPVLKKAPEHAQAIVWPHAQLMQWQGEYEQAIKLYQAANRQPQSTWAIIDCRLAMKQYGKAIDLTKELESLGGGVAAQACLKAADIYRSISDKKKEVQQLQLVVRRYDGTRQASDAHVRLENYGVKIIGGEVEADP